MHFGIPMPFESKYSGMLEDRQVRRWFDNLKAKSVLTATVYLRSLGHYCELNRTTPERMLSAAKKKGFQDSFMDFVRKLEKEGKAGSYIARFKKVVLSWVRFNGIDLKLKVNIANEYLTPTIDDERVPTREELGRVLRKASSRGRVAIAMMAFSGLRPETLGNYEGTEGLKLGDLNELSHDGGKPDFERIPSIVAVKPSLSKGRHQYFTFIPEEGALYIGEYLADRVSSGEQLGKNSPLLQFDPRGVRKNRCLRTALVTRDIREAIIAAGLKMRPYVLRAYFATGLDIAESKGLISHPWRMFFMGHKGDIESRYSTNKRLPPEMIEQMRESYRKSSKYIETRVSEVGEEDAKRYLQTQLLLAVGYKQEEIDRIDLQETSNEEFQKLLRDKVSTAMVNNGNRQRVVAISSVAEFINQGYEFVASLPDGNAIMKLPL